MVAIIFFFETCCPAMLLALLETYSKFPLQWKEKPAIIKPAKVLSTKRT